LDAAPYGFQCADFSAELCEHEAMSLPLEFLSLQDADRAIRTLQKLLRHGIEGWALTGGLAVELHCAKFTGEASTRALNDIDFVVDSFGAIPPSLAEDFIFRHIHPLDPPGKTLAQLVDAETAVRVDVFRAYGEEMARSKASPFPPAAIRLVSAEDLLARAARLCLDLAEGNPVPAVYASDFRRLAECIPAERVEPVWPDHRKPSHPETYAEAGALLKQLIPAGPELLISRSYSTDIHQTCSRCSETPAFRLADPKVMLSLLGYC
jgi:enoyl-CoA hydratase/carnithine racemase